MTRRPDLPRFGNLRSGGNLSPPQRGSIRGALALLVALIGGLWLAYGFGF